MKNERTEELSSFLRSHIEEYDKHIRNLTIPVGDIFRKPIKNKGSGTTTTTTTVFHKCCKRNLLECFWFKINVSIINVYIYHIHL